jgi:hypothetical protein
MHQIKIARCAYSTLSPKPTSKKTKSRWWTLPGMPSTRRQPMPLALNPLYNHVLDANKNLSRRERHFRQCLAQAMCATLPYQPDRSHFIPPYWLKVRGTDERAKVSLILKSNEFKNQWIWIWILL